MDLKKSKSQAIKYLENINPRKISYQPREIVNWLKGLNDSGKLTDKEIENALEKGLKKIARGEFNKIIKGSTQYKMTADGNTSTEYFAYGLNKGIFSQKEIDKIPFNHGENVESFIKNYYNENLLQESKEKILTLQELPLDISKYCWH